RAWAKSPLAGAPAAEAAVAPATTPAETAVARIVSASTRRRRSMPTGWRQPSSTDNAHRYLAGACSSAGVRDRLVAGGAVGVRRRDGRRVLRDRPRHALDLHCEAPLQLPGRPVVAPRLLELLRALRLELRQLLAVLRELGPGGGAAGGGGVRGVAG